MESNSTAFLIKIKLRHSLGRPSRSDFVQSEVHEILKRIYMEKDRLNSNGNELPIDFACGWAISDDYKDSTIQILFDRADSYMYKNKQLCKEQNMHSFQICGDIPEILGDIK